MKLTIAARSIALLSALALGACATSRDENPRGDGERRSSICRPDAARALVGQAAPADQVVLRQVGGTVVRRIAPGDATTKDFREDRVTLTIADGQVVSAACG